MTIDVTRYQTRALVIGVVAAALSLIGAFFNRAQFFHSYLFAWLFWCGLSLGALVIVMMQALTGGQWGTAIRALATSAFRNLPMMALLFVPVMIGLHDIYAWTDGVTGPHKAQYLNAPFFIARSVVYFVILISLAFALRERDTTALCAGGLIAYVFCMNFASTDWVMSLNPEWYSTIFVEIFAAGQFLSALALMTALLTFFASKTIPVKVFHDLGNLLLAFVIFWTYVAFAEFLIIWSGNLPKEISWYLDRSSDGWEWFAVALAFIAFLLPFALLLSRTAKRSPQRLGIIAVVIVGACVLVNFWLVAPSFHPRAIYVHWLDVAEFIALGGFWFALFFHFLKQRPSLPNEWLDAKQND